METRMEDLLFELQKLSPMPPDHSLTEEQLKRFDSIVNRLSGIRDPAIIKPLLESFGYGSGFGLYWRVLHLLENFRWEELKPFLIPALKHRNPGTRMWAALMLGRRREEAEKAIPDLLLLLGDEHELIRAHAVTALSMVGGADVQDHIQRLKDDPSGEVRASVREALESF